MIAIYAQDSMTAIMPLGHSSLADAARVYNCGDDSRYATGQEGVFSVHELSSLLERIKASDNEFITGIYIKAPCRGANTVMRFVGLCSGMLHTNTLWIKQLNILPEYRRRGIGTRAVDILLDYAVRSHNVRDVYLSAVEKNTVGLYFWKKLGFCESRRIEKAVFGEKLPSNIIIMQKTCSHSMSKEG